MWYYTQSGDQRRKKLSTILINSLVFRYSSLMKNLKKYKHLCERINFKDWMHHAWLIGKNIFKQYIIPKAKIKRTSHNKEMEKIPIYTLSHVCFHLIWNLSHSEICYFLFPIFFFFIVFSLNLARSKYPNQNYFLYVIVMFFN